MGKNNRARRAAKAKKHQQKGQGRPGPTPARDAAQFILDERHSWGATSVPNETDRVADLWNLGVDAVHRNDQSSIADVVERLSSASATIVEREAERDLLRLVGVLWDNGWQPRELIRQCRRSTTAAGGRLAEATVVADHVRRDPATIDPAWTVQIDALGARERAGSSGWLIRWSSAEGIARTAQIHGVLHVLAALYSCGPIEELIAPPGGSRRADAVVDLRGAADPVLERVRALLAQAESTTFEAEAEAFTAKAQELMTRHAIDLAMVAAASSDAGGRTSERPTTIRVPIDDPYADMKSLMLQIVAEVSRCRAIFHPRYSFTTVIGFAHDLAATEMLFTSLLVQAQSALAEAGRHAPPGARTRSRSFKSSFLMGYAGRVGERLSEINRSVAEAAEHETSRSVLPALVARADVVDEEMDRRFGDAVMGQSRGGYDGFGYSQGAAAGDRAQLAAADLSRP